jgi:hypothetical protein
MSRPSHQSALIARVVYAPAFDISPNIGVDLVGFFCLLGPSRPQMQCKSKSYHDGCHDKLIELKMQSHLTTRFWKSELLLNETDS